MKRHILAPLAHLLWFLLVFLILMVFIMLQTLLLRSLPGAQGEYLYQGFASLFHHAFWIAFPLSMPLSLFLTLFYVRRGREHRFLMGVVVLVTSTILFTGTFITMNRILPWDRQAPPPEPEAFWIEGYFHHLQEGNVYVLQEKGEPSAVLLSHVPPPSGWRFQVRDLDSLVMPDHYNIHVEPWMPEPKIFSFLAGDLLSLIRNFFTAAGLGFLPLLAFIAAQGWFCVQTWVLIRTGRWPFLNLVLGVGAFFLFMKTHFLIGSELYGLLPEWFPEPLPFIVISLPFFFWNVFSPGGAAGDA